MSNLIFRKAVLLCAAVFCSSLFARAASAQDDAGAPPDHPLVVAAAASLDRVLDRAVEVMQVNGAASTREEVVALIRQNLQQANGEVPTDLPWLDLTKPVGMMFFYDSKFLVPDDVVPTKKTEEEEETSAAAPDGIFGMMSGTGVTLNRVVAFFPVKDFQQMVAMGNLTPVAGKANCFRDDKGVEQYLRRFGSYVVTGLDGDTVEHCPDPRDIARSVLGKNDLAVSLQLKGLPPLLRTLGAEGIKSVYEAGLQRRDEEQERDYLLRRVLGDIARELLDLAMTQVDEVTLGFRIEAGLKSFVDLEVNGTNDGKLAKFAAEMTSKKSAFDPLWNADYDQSLGISLSLPTRHTKPLAAAIRNYVATAKDADQVKAFSENATLFNLGCRILDSNQFEFLWTGERDGDANVTLLGLKLPPNREFPQQFEGWIRAATKDDADLSITSLEGWPVYQLKTIPFFGDALGRIFNQFVGVDFDDEGTSCYSWLVATPDALWLCSREGLSDDSIPGLLHRAMDVKTLAADATRSRRLIAPFRMSLNTVFGEDESDESDARPDQISIEMVPTSRGLRFTMAFDPIYAEIVPQDVKTVIWGRSQPSP